MKRINVNGILVEEVIFKTKFSCNYLDCHGACCNAPLYEEVNGKIIKEELEGGELTPEEALELQSKCNDLVKFCDKDCKNAVNDKPVYSSEGVYYTRLLGDKCVLCNTKKKTCALKLAHAEGVVSFDIPRSCGLYPLNYYEEEHYGQVRKNIELLHTFDRYCVSSYEKGERENITLVEFMKSILIRSFGKEFYDALWKVQQRYL